MKYRRLSPPTIDGAIDRYLKGESTPAIATTLNCDPSALLYHFQKRGIAARSASAAHRQYSLNEQAFDAINQEEASYWLGFLAADGYIGPRNALTLSLQVRDSDHVERFRHFLGSTAPVRIYQYPALSFARLSVRSSHLCVRLATLGVGRQKGSTAEWPAELSEIMVRHFLRGLVDGDGCFNRRHTKYPTPDFQFSLIGHEAVIGPTINHFREQLMVGGTGPFHEARHAPQQVVQFRMSGRQQVARLHHYLYDGATIALMRKADPLPGLYD